MKQNTMLLYNYGRRTEYSRCGYLQKQKGEILLMAQLVGIKCITTQKGNKGFIYSFLDEYTDYDKENAQCVGKQSVSEYATKLFNVDVGSEVNLVYGKGFQGKAQLINVLPVSQSNIKTDK